MVHSSESLDTVSRYTRLVTSENSSKLYHGFEAWAQVELSIGRSKSQSKGYRGYRAAIDGRDSVFGGKMTIGCLISACRGFRTVGSGNINSRVQGQLNEANRCTYYSK